MVPTSKSHKMPRSFSLSLKNCVAMPGRSSGLSYQESEGMGRFLPRAQFSTGVAWGLFEYVWSGRYVLA